MRFSVGAGFPRPSGVIAFFGGQIEESLIDY